MCKPFRGAFFCQYLLSHIGMRLGEPRFAMKPAHYGCMVKRRSDEAINVNCPGFITDRTLHALGFLFPR